MLHGHASVAKKLLRAFSAAKTAPRRSKAIAALAAAALASTVRHNGTAGSVAIPNPDGGAMPGGGGGANGSGTGVASSRGIPNLSSTAGGERDGDEGEVDTLVAAASGEKFSLGGSIRIIGGGGGGVDVLTGSARGGSGTPVEGEGSNAVAATLDRRDSQASSCAGGVDDDGGGGNDDENEGADAGRRMTSVLGRRASEAGCTVRDHGILFRTLFAAYCKLDGGGIRSIYSITTRGGRSLCSAAAIQ